VTAATVTSRRVKGVGELARRYPWETLLLGLLVVTIVYNLANSTNYLGVDNLINLFKLSIEKAIVVVIMAFCVIAGEIDLSVASTMGLGAAVLATLHGQTAVPFALAVLLAIGVGAVSGLIQGAIVAKLGIPSLVVTLAGLIGLRGAARVFLEDRSVGRFPGWFGDLGRDGLIGPIPLSLLIFFGGLAAGAVVLSRTALGRRLYVIGDSADVARYAGVHVDRIRIGLFVTSGTVAALAGVLYAARLGSVRGDMAQGFELDIVTMVLLGGVSIFGGTGTMVGVGLAVFVVLNVRNGLGLANVEANTQTGVVGAILIASVLVRNLLDSAAGGASPAPRPARRWRFPRRAPRGKPSH